MRFDVLTLFPRMFEGVFGESLLGKARLNKRLDLRVLDIRDHADNKHRSVDDRPYGGGAGMVMSAEPVYQALKSLKATGKSKTKPLVIYLSPQGERLTRSLVERLAKEKHIVLLCGHYEGIDERLFSWIDLEVSVGDVVLTGGEIPAMAVVDAVARYVPGVVKEADSVRDDSFAEGRAGLLDNPHYTRPAVWRRKKVPDVLLSGDHKAIAAWRETASREATRRKRPDLLDKRNG